VVNHAVVERQSDRYCNSFSTWDELVTLLFGVFERCYAESYKLLNTRQDKRKMRLRSVMVVLVCVILLDFRCLRKVYTKGNDLTNKQVLMAATA